jgi:hypothetical protein
MHITCVSLVPGGHSFLPGPSTLSATQLPQPGHRAATHFMPFGHFFPAAGTQRPPRRLKTPVKACHFVPGGQSFPTPPPLGKQWQRGGIDFVQMLTSFGPQVRPPGAGAQRSLRVPRKIIISPGLHRPFSGPVAQAPSLKLLNPAARAVHALPKVRPPAHTGL